MSYIILSDSRKFEGQKVALVDRGRFKKQWWTEHINKAMIFVKLTAAEIQVKKLGFNNPKVYTLENGKRRLNKAIIRQSGLERALDRKVNEEWHDDDWDEGKNDKEF